MLQIRGQIERVYVRDKLTTQGHHRRFLQYAPCAIELMGTFQEVGPILAPGKIPMPQSTL